MTNDWYRSCCTALMKLCCLCWRRREDKTFSPSKGTLQRGLGGATRIGTEEEGGAKKRGGGHKGMRGWGEEQDGVWRGGE
ncbi:hypothetical protein BaRGS_00029115, partial [Batillaria attramentaria]